MLDYLEAREEHTSPAANQDAAAALVHRGSSSTLPPSQPSGSSQDAAAAPVHSGSTSTPPASQPIGRTQPSTGSSGNSRERSTNSRKRVRDPSNWIRNKSREGHQSGVEHVNQKGEVKPARAMGQGCKAGCRYQCQSRISDIARRTFFTQYWGLKNSTRQWEFLNSYTTTGDPAKHSTMYGVKKRSVSRSYFIRDEEGQNVRVCQTMFLTTLDISERKVYTANERLKKKGATISPLKQGTQPKVNPEKEEKLIASIDKHIGLFEVTPSHFCRKARKRQYLETGLSINKMYQMYQQWMKTENPTDPVASPRKYRDRFVAAYNFGFFKPKKDQCELCNICGRASETLLAKLRPKLDAHLKNKDLSRDQRTRDKKDAQEDPTICYAVFDLQKVLQTPKDETSVLYYKRKLATYNLTIYDGARKIGRCYVWHEGEGRRGANEVASCLAEFIEEHVQLYSTKEFRLWADNCAGQNKNKFVFTQLMRLSEKLGVKIVLRYLETGHTQNEADSVHHMVEEASKNHSVFTSEEWIKKIQEAKQSGEPYLVRRMKGKFQDLHEFCDKYMKWNGHPGVNWKLVRELIFSPGEKPAGTVSVRHSLAEELQDLYVMKRLRGHPVNMKTHQLKNAYPRPLCVNSKKLKDLADLCKSHVIPDIYHEFYRQLVGFPGLSTVTVEVENEQDARNEEGEVWAHLEGNDDPDTDYEAMEEEDQRDKQRTVETQDAEMIPVDGDAVASGDASDMC